MEIPAEKGKKKNSPLKKKLSYIITNNLVRMSGDSD